MHGGPKVREKEKSVSRERSFAGYKEGRLHKRRNTKRVQRICESGGANGRKRDEKRRRKQKKEATDIAAGKARLAQNKEKRTTKTVQKWDKHQYAGPGVEC